MITKEQAMTGFAFHYGDCLDVGLDKRTGRPKIQTWRRNGRTKTWKTRPMEFKVPIAYGMYNHGYITHNNAEQFHLATECPLKALDRPMPWSSGFDHDAVKSSELDDNLNNGETAEELYIKLGGKSDKKVFPDADKLYGGA